MKCKEFTFKFNGKEHHANYHVVPYANAILYWVYPDDQEIVDHLGTQVNFAYQDRRLIWPVPGHPNILKSTIADALVKNESLEPYINS